MEKVRAAAPLLKLPTAADDARLPLDRERPIVQAT